MARVAKPTPRFLKRLQALGIPSGSALSRAIAHEIGALAGADALPGPLDFETTIPPTHSAWVRRLTGENIWLLYAWDDEHVSLLTVTTTPPVPIT